MKKQLIPKNQLGGPIARLAQPTNNKGSWGDRGAGNEGQSFIENALYTIGDLGGLLTLGDKLIHPEKYEVKTDYGTPVEIDGKMVYPLAEPEQVQIGYPTLIPGLKGIPTEELTNFFKTKWGPAYNSLASTKSRLLKLGRSADLTTSKPYIAFQKLNEQLKQMVDEVNNNVVKPTINVIDETIEAVKPERLKNTNKYRHVVKDQEARGLLGSRSKVAKEADKLSRADAYNDWRLINPGRPATKRAMDYIETTVRRWSNQSPAVQKALQKYDLKVAKGLTGEPLQKAREDMIKTILEHSPGYFNKYRHLF